MGWALASIFGYLVILFLFLFTLNLAWDKWLRPWLFSDKIDSVVEDAKEKYVEQTVHATLEETLKPRRSNEPK